MVPHRGLLLLLLLPASSAWTAAGVRARQLSVITTPRTTWSLAPPSPSTRLSPLMDKISFGSETELTGKEADDAMKADFDFDPVLVGGVFAAFLAAVVLFVAVSL